MRPERGRPIFGGGRRYCGEPADRCLVQDDGKVMEKRGGNGTHTFRGFQAQKPAVRANLAASGCYRWPPKSHGKEGFDGSSPSEGSAKYLQNGPFLSD